MSSTAMFDLLLHRIKRQFREAGITIRGRGGARRKQNARREAGPGMATPVPARQSIGTRLPGANHE